MLPTKRSLRAACFDRNQRKRSPPDGGKVRGDVGGEVKYTTEVLKVAKEEAEAEGKELEWRF